MLSSVSGAGATAQPSLLDRVLAHVQAELQGTGEEKGLPPFVQQFLPPSKSQGEQGAGLIGCTPPSKGDESAPVSQSPRSRGTHIVGRGEYLSVIAPRYGLTWRQLYWANRDRISHPDLLHVGQALRIPPKDLKVPHFAYKPMFTGPGGSYERGTHVPPKHTGKPPVGKPPTGKPSTDTSVGKGSKDTSAPSKQKPPGTQPVGGSLPEPPPAPDTSGLPPSLPD